MNELCFLFLTIDNGLIKVFYFLLQACSFEDAIKKVLEDWHTLQKSLVLALYD
jgi:hypothetical protein